MNTKQKLHQLRMNEWTTLFRSESKRTDCQRMVQSKQLIHSHLQLLETCSERRTRQPDSPGHYSNRYP